MKTRNFEFYKSMTFLPFQILLLPHFFNVLDVIFCWSSSSNILSHKVFEIALNMCLFCKTDIFLRGKKVVQGHKNNPNIYAWYPWY